MKRSQADLVSILRHIGEFSCHEIFKDEQSLLFRKVPYAGKKKIDVCSPRKALGVRRIKIQTLWSSRSS